MFSAFERRVAFRYLRARKGERFVSIIAIFSLIGIALGVATLIIVMSVMNGFRQELLAQILGLNGDIGVYGAGHNITQYDAAAGRLEKIPGVISAIPIVQGEVLMTGPHGGAIGGVARGIQPGGLAKLRTVSHHIVAGSLKDFTGGDIAIGAGVASQLGISRGGAITLVLPQGDATIIGTIPRIQSFHVSAIFRTGMAQYDSSFVFLPLASAQTLFRAQDAATQIQLFVKNPDNTIMMVKDKTADIAILRTMGATSGSIMRIFFMVGASVGVIGTIAGFGLGVVFCAYIEQIRQFVQGLTGTQLFNPTVYYLESLPAKLVWSQVVEVVVIAIGLSFVATLYPSWRAARTDPVEALRHE
ncbi:MAG: multidrug ABC transporter substrate-binding protein [Acidiphilium sp. 21-68-69]|nr:MAG: multidrug ABC transporter substrate-binding protein [Acidiphilium sp. 21-68-69]